MNLATKGAGESRPFFGLTIRLVRTSLIAMDTWKLQDAKARFSEVVDRALRHGPQIVTRHGEKAVVVVAYRDFAAAEPAQDFKSFLLSMPKEDLDLDFPRHPPRKTRL